MKNHRKPFRLRDDFRSLVYPCLCAVFLFLALNAVVGIASLRLKPIQEQLPGGTLTDMGLASVRAPDLPLRVSRFDARIPLHLHEPVEASLARVAGVFNRAAGREIIVMVGPSMAPRLWNGADRVLTNFEVPNLAAVSWTIPPVLRRLLTPAILIGFQETAWSESSAETESSQEVITTFFWTVTPFLGDLLTPAILNKMHKKGWIEAPVAMNQDGLATGSLTVPQMVNSLLPQAVLDKSQEKGWIEVKVVTVNKVLATAYRLDYSRFNGDLSPLPSEILFQSRCFRFPGLAAPPGCLNTRDFDWVLAHELGHALGLHHRDDDSSVMKPGVNPMENLVDLSPRDKLLLKVLAD